MSIHPPNDPLHPESDASPASPDTIEQPIQRMSWPTIIGLVAVVYGVFGLLDGTRGLTSQLVVIDPAESLPAGTGMMEEIQSPAMNVWFSGGTIISLGLAVLLIGGGIQVTRRRSNGAPCIKIWAMINVVLTFLGVVIVTVNHRDQFEAMIAFLGMKAVVRIGYFMFLSILVGSGVPAFMLVWFSRARVRRDTVGWL